MQLICTYDIRLVILHEFGFSGWILTTLQQGVNLLLVPMIEQYVYS